MSNQEFYSRIIHKHDIEENWNKAINFIPKQGEIIVYDIDENYDYERIKIGDGENNVNNLPFLVNKADFNQNNPTASDYIKNRTHWIKDKIDILPETTLVGSNGQFPIITSFTLVEGKTYIVNWAGTEYTLMAKHMAMPDGTSGTGLGNFSGFGGENTGEPFLLGVFDPVSAENMGIPALAMSYEGLSEVVVSITQEIIHKLDNKYLNLDWIPTTKGRVLAENLIFNIEDDSGSTVWIDCPEDLITGGMRVLVEINGRPYEVTARYELFTDGDLAELTWLDISEDMILGTYSGLPIIGMASTTPGQYTVSLYLIEDNKMPDRFLPEHIYRDEWSVLLPATKITMDETNTDGIFDIDFSGVYEGQKLIVTYNGVEYEDMWKKFHSIWGIDMLYAGNPVNSGDNDQGDDNGLPYYICVSNSLIVNNVENDSQSVISIQKCDIVKVPTKYLPDGVPYYIDKGMGDLLPETTLAGSGGQFPINTPFELIEGETYNINWNGTIYLNRIAKSASMGDVEGIAVGNFIGVGGEDTGEEFLIGNLLPNYVETVGFYGLALSYEGLSEATVSIEGKIKEINKLPNECLDLEWIPTIKETPIFKEKEITVNSGAYIESFSHNNTIQAGMELCAIINGTKYICDVIADKDGTDDILIVAPRGYDNNPPFAFVFSAYDFSMQAQEDGTYIISIYIAETNKLPEKFLPDCLPYEEKIFIDILPETQISGVHSGSLPITTPFTLVDGEEYVVTWNGVDYTLTAESRTANGFTGVVIGNLQSAGGEDTGEPFIVIAFSPESAEEVGFAGAAASYEDLTSAIVSIKGKSLVASTTYVDEVIEDKKLIPSPSNPTAGDILTYNGTEWVTITKADLIAEIIAALPSAEEASF